jgi:hypothetical protein
VPRDPVADAPKDHVSGFVVTPTAHDHKVCGVGFRFGSDDFRFWACSRSGGYRGRTGDLRLAKAALSQLS